MKRYDTIMTVKVAMVLTKSTVGGTTELCLQWSRALMEHADVDIRVWSLIPPTSTALPRSLHELEGLLGPVVDLDHRSRSNWPRTLSRLRSGLREFGPDIVHAYFPVAEFAAQLATHRQVPVVGTIVSTGGNVPRWQRIPLLPSSRRPKAILSADRWIAVGHTVANSSSQRNYPLDAIDVVYPAFTILSEVQPTSASPYAPGNLPRSDRVTLICVGRLVPSKHVEHVIHALSLLPPNYQLLIVGSGPEETHLETLIDQLDLGGRVSLAGFRDDVAEMMRTADVYVSASDTEGLVGYATLEAIREGLPVVAPRIDSVTEILSKNEVELANPHDVHDIVRAIREFEDARLRETRVLAAQNRLQAVFDSSKVANDLITVYSKVLEEAGA